MNIRGNSIPKARNQINRNTEPPAGAVSECICNSYPIRLQIIHPILKPTKCSAMI